MKQLAKRVLIVLSAAVLATGMVTAHHSLGMFDMTKTTAVTGTVRVFEWTNPHAWLWITVANAGDNEAWGFELAALSMIRRNGLSKDSFKPGDKLTVSMHPAKQGHGGSFIFATFADGHTVGRAPGNGPPPATP